MAFDVDGVNIFFHQLVLLLLFDPKLFHRADLYAVLGGGQHLNLQKQHKYVKNNQKNLKKIYEILIREEKPIENNMNELANILDIQIGKSKYNESIKEILSGKELQ